MLAPSYTLFYRVYFKKQLQEWIFGDSTNMPFIWLHFHRILSDTTASRSVLTTDCPLSECVSTSLPKTTRLLSLPRVTNISYSSLKDLYKLCLRITQFTKSNFLIILLTKHRDFVPHSTLSEGALPHRPLCPVPPHLCPPGGRLSQ